uniref:Bestrophin homolog n=2 Tax=Clastoptera arizonana TaxID=38151 RepID=A0A1B6E365_9HEMI
MMDERSPMAKYWMPLVWATNIINRARKDALISSDQLVQTLLMELSEHRRRLGSIISYDTVCVPLVYTQVVTLSVYTYFIAALVGSQFTTSDPDDYFVFPLISVLQFCFYIGWLKVAEVLIGPFGEDDDDIELNWLIDRHIKAAYMIVDEMHEEHPELLKDQYWDEVVPKDLPYTIASEHYRKYEPKGSAEDYKVKEADAVYANLMHSRKSTAPDDVYADYESVDTPLVERRKNWFQRQMQRVGSIRSSSTTYSSGLFGRTRHNSVYSSPDNNALPVTMIPGQQAPSINQTSSSHKVSIYDRLIGKSTRQNRGGKGSSKLNGSLGMRNRPRIPTPDVTKEVVDRENRLAQLTNNNNGLVSPTALTNALVAHTQVPYNTTELPVSLQVVLSPIQEHDSHQSTITSNTSGAKALAKAVLSPTLNSAGLGNVSMITTAQGTITGSPVAISTVAMTQPLLTSLGITSSTPNTPVITRTPIVLNDFTVGDKDDSNGGGSSNTSVSGGEDRSRKASITSQAKRGEVYV